MADKTVVTKTGKTIVLRDNTPTHPRPYLGLHSKEEMDAIRAKFPFVQSYDTSKPGGGQDVTESEYADFVESIVFELLNEDIDIAKHARKDLKNSYRKGQWPSEVLWNKALELHATGENLRAQADQDDEYDFDGSDTRRDTLDRRATFLTKAARAFRSSSDAVSAEEGERGFESLGNGEFDSREHPMSPPMANTLLKQEVPPSRLNYFKKG